MDAVKPSHAASDNAVARSRFETNPQAKHKVIHLYCLSFHHFDDDQAHQILANTVRTADAFAILELQERRLSSIVLMLLAFWEVFLVVLVYFWHRPAYLLFTFGVPLLPTLISFDGLVSSLRSRTLDELWRLALVAQASQGDLDGDTKPQVADASGTHGRPRRMSQGDWSFQPTRTMHTFPLGYLTGFVGTRTASRSPV